MTTGPTTGRTAEEDQEWREIRARHTRYMTVRGLPRPPHIRDADAARDARGLAATGVLFGPDVSQYQGRPAWAAVRAAGCRFAIRKATEGRTFLDGSAGYNRAGIPAAGLAPGAYHFLYFSQEYVDKPALWGAQAAWFARNTDAGEGHVLDVEAAATAGHWLGVREWCAEYRRLFPGHPLIGYSNRSLWRNRSRVPYDPRDLFDSFWHAGVGDGYYTTASGSLPSQWGAVGSLSNSVAGMGFPEVALWQFTDHASVSGIGGTCDGNAWRGTLPELQAAFTGRTTTPPPVLEDSMSDADVQKILTYLGGDAFAGDIKAAVHSTPIGKLTNTNGSPVTLGQVAGSLYGAAGQAVDLSPATLAAVAAAVAGQLPSTGGASRADLEAALSAVLARIRVVPGDPDGDQPARLTFPGPSSSGGEG
jgi:GH25 family lysozyme M1 (1,4-beta-N-acetylmuramidase)